MPWPKRSHICLDCRTLLPDAACPASGRHRVTTLADEAGRERLLDEVWGPKSIRQRLIEAGKVGGGTAAASTSFHACDVVGALELDWFFVIFLAGALFWFLGSLIVSVLRRRRARRSGRGASALGLQVGRMRGVAGTVRAAASDVDPITRQACVAYSAELRDTRGVMLRDAATSGFDVELVTGETVRVPAGLIAIDLQRAAELAPKLDDYRRHVDPLRDQAADLEALPGDEVAVVVVRAGDSVEVLADTERVSVSGVGEPAGYRSEAPSVLVARGLVRLRPC